MDLDTFIEFSKKRDEKAYVILNQANDEYAKNTNKFENFDMIADFFNAALPEFDGKFKPQHVAIIYFLKHFISIMKDVSIREDMSGRFIDAANYIRLIDGMAERDRLGLSDLDNAIKAVNTAFNGSED